MTDKRERPFKLNMRFGEALARFSSAKPHELQAVNQAREKAKMEPSQTELQLVKYHTIECDAAFTLDPSNETVWATQRQIADAFGISTSNVRGHLVNIFKEGELDESAVAREFRATGTDGKVYNYLHYSLDAILSVGYRVSSKRATAFRQWATQTLKDYITQGFAINEARLRDDPHALRELAARVRALRSDEKNIYQSVRDAFAFGSSDYDSSAQVVRSFYAKLQDRFLHAITGKTAAELKLERADHKKPSMGLTSTKGTAPERADADIAKNYLEQEELYGLHILCEQFLLFIESKAIRGQALTMKEMAVKFEELMRVQGHTVFPEYKEYLAQKAKTHAQIEYNLWRDRVRSLPPEQRHIA